MLPFRRRAVAGPDRARILQADLVAAVGPAVQTGGDQTLEMLGGHHAVQAVDVCEGQADVDRAGGVVQMKQVERHSVLRELFAHLGNDISGVG